MSMFVRPDASSSYSHSGFSNNAGSNPNPPMRAIQQQQQQPQHAAKKAPMMRRLADVTNKLMGPGRNSNTIQKDSSMKRGGNGANQNANFAQFAIPQVLNMKQQEQQHGRHGDPHQVLQSNDLSLFENYQQQHQLQQPQHQLHQQQANAHQQQQDDRQFWDPSSVPQDEMRIQLHHSQRQAQAVNQPIIRVQLTYSDIPTPRERRQKRTGKKRPVVHAYTPVFSPVQEDKLNELPTPQREAALELARNVPPRRDPVDPSRLTFDEVLVETDSARPGERVVVADAFVRRPFFSKYASRTGHLLRKSQSPGGGGWMVEFGDLGVQFFSTGSINGVHHLAYARESMLSNVMSSRSLDSSETSMPPPQISVPSRTHQNDTSSGDLAPPPSLLAPSTVNDMGAGNVKPPPQRSMGPQQMQMQQQQHKAYTQSHQVSMQRQQQSAQQLHELQYMQQKQQPTNTERQQNSQQNPKANAQSMLQQFAFI